MFIENAYWWHCGFGKCWIKLFTVHAGPLHFPEKKRTERKHDVKDGTSPMLGRGITSLLAGCIT